MGLTKSTTNHKYAKIYEIEPKVRFWRRRFELLNLKESDVGMLYGVFRDCDLANRNSVNTRHLASYCRLEKVPFTNRMLATFKKGQGFAGFVFELWDICTTDEADLADLVFSLYDLNRSGDITGDEAQVMLTELYGEENFKEGSRKRSEIMLQLYGSPTDPKFVLRKQFRDFTKRQSTVLFLAFMVQKKLIDAILGRSFWSSIAKRRAQMTVDELITVSQLRDDICSGKIAIKDFDDDDEDGNGAGKGKKSKRSSGSKASSANASSVKSNSVAVDGSGSSAAGGGSGSSGGTDAGKNGGPASLKRGKSVSGIPSGKGGPEGGLSGANTGASSRGFRKKDRGKDASEGESGPAVTYITEKGKTKSESAIRRELELAEKHDKKLLKKPSVSGSSSSAGAGSGAGSHDASGVGAADDSLDSIPKEKIVLKKAKSGKMVDPDTLDVASAKALIKASLSRGDDDEGDDDSTNNNNNNEQKDGISGKKGSSTFMSGLFSKTKEKGMKSKDKEKEKESEKELSSHKKSKGVSASNKSTDSVPAPAGILVTDQSKKSRKFSDKRVLFDLPDEADEEEDVDYNALGMDVE